MASVLDDQADVVVLGKSNPRLHMSGLGGIDGIDRVIAMDTRRVFAGEGVARVILEIRSNHRGWVLNTETLVRQMQKCSKCLPRVTYCGKGNSQLSARS